MLSIEILIAFFSASLLLALVPGPDNIFVLTQSIFQGKKTTFRETKSMKLPCFVIHYI